MSTCSDSGSIRGETKELLPPMEVNSAGVLIDDEEVETGTVSRSLESNEDTEEITTG